MRTMLRGDNALKSVPALIVLISVLGVPASAAHAAEPAPDPIRPGPALQSVPLGGAGVAQATGRPFALAGVTWDDPAVALRTTVEVRARSVGTGAWSAWQALESDGRAPAEPGSADDPGRGRTDPVWLGTSDAVQVRTGGALPSGARLDLINPDAEENPRARSADGARTFAAPALPARPVPGYVSRASWGADEAMVENAPEYTPGIKAFFVHHTATTNNYSCADSARIVRGIQAYHVRSNGWNDIGYNFLVDRCGTLFEGRKGGVGRNVLGAHTLGFNSYSSAIAVIGNFDGAAAPARARAVVAQVAAYKLGTYNAVPTGRVALISSGSDKFPRGTRVTLNVISGHRDTNSTTCPGDMLYGQLSSIRRVAGAGPAGLRMAAVSGAVAHRGTFYTRGLIRPSWALSTPSSMMNRFDVYVDGRLVTTARNATRIAVLRLTPGRHTVTINAVHLSGRTSRLVRTVYADVTPPKFVSGPSMTLRTGSVNGIVPVRLDWGIGDPSGLRALGLSSPRPVVLGLARRSYDTNVAPSGASTWAVKAIDRAGNTGVGSVRRTPGLISDAAGARAGSWDNLRNRRYIGGSALQSGTRGSSIAWTFTGRSASLAATRTPASGVATIYVDGVRTAVVDLRATTTVNRLAVWAKNWGASGRHTIRVVSSGTRPGIVVDGLVVLR